MTHCPKCGLPEAMCKCPVVRHAPHAGMTKDHALKVVVQAARAHANGHEHCLLINEACDLLSQAPRERDLFG